MVIVWWIIQLHAYFSVPIDSHTFLFCLFLFLLVKVIYQHIMYVPWMPCPSSWLTCQSISSLCFWLMVPTDRTCRLMIFVSWYSCLVCSSSTPSVYSCLLVLLCTWLLVVATDCLWFSLGLSLFLQLIVIFLTLLLFSIYLSDCLLAWLMLLSGSLVLCM